MKRAKRLFVMLLSIILISFSMSSAAFAGGIPSAVLKAANSVVRVVVPVGSGYSTGTGFVIYSDSKETLIATNHHVIEGGYSFYIYTDGIEGDEAQIIFTTEIPDLCLLRLSGKYDLKALTFGSAKQGDAVYTIGFPGVSDVLMESGFAYSSADATMTDGIVSALRQVDPAGDGTIVSCYQVTAPINHGNSGGPLLNEQGQVIGINTWTLSGYSDDAEGVFASINISELEKQLEANGIHLGSSVNPLVIVIPLIIVLAAAAELVLLKKKKTAAAVAAAPAPTPVQNQAPAAAYTAAVNTQAPRQAAPVYKQQSPAAQNNTVRPQTAQNKPAPTSIIVRCTMGPLAGQNIYGQQITIGRDNNRCNFAFPADTQGVSREHCKVTVANGRITLTDLNSSNGTRLRNGTTLQPLVPVTLNDGDEFAIAKGIHFRVNLR